MYLVGFPLLVIPFAIYNIVEFLMPGSAPGVFWTHNAIRMELASGAEWTLTAGDLLIAAALLLLYAEMLKSTHLSSRAIMDHVLSTLLFIVMLIEFLLVRQAATATFFLMMIVALVDVIGGFSVTIRSARRDVSIDSVDTLHR